MKLSLIISALFVSCTNLAVQKGTIQLINTLNHIIEYTYSAPIDLSNSGLDPSWQFILGQTAKDSHHTIGAHETVHFSAYCINKDHYCGETNTFKFKKKLNKEYQKTI